MDLNKIIPDEQLQILHDFCRLIPSMKNKFFNLGRDMDKFNKLCTKFEAMQKQEKKEV